MANGLFKYFPTDKDKLETFISGHIYLTPPKFFNDPWDFLVRSEPWAKEHLEAEGFYDMPEFRADVNSTINLGDEARDQQNGLSKLVGVVSLAEDRYLITNNHVVKDATQVRLVTSAGLIDAKVVQVDAANDLALLKADGRFAPLPIAASRTVNLGGTVATVGFPNIGMQGFAPKLAKGEIASLSGAGDDPRYFQISVPCQPGKLEFKL